MAGRPAGTPARAPFGHAFGRRSGLPSVAVVASDGSRAYEISSGLVMGLAGLAFVLATATIAAGSYLAFRDDIIDTAITKRLQVEQAYEDRIAALRSEIDRINSRQLIDQDAFEAKIDKLMARQDDLGSQDRRLMALIDKAKLAPPKRPAAPAGVVAPLPPAAPDSIVSIGTPQPVQALPVQPPATGPTVGDSIEPLATDKPALAPAAPHPLDGTPLRQSWLERWNEPAATATAGRDRRVPALRIAEIERSIETMARRRSEAMTVFAGLAETNSRTIETVVGRLGLRLAEADAPPPAPQPKPTLAAAVVAGTNPGVNKGLGGPFVPVTDAEHGLARLEWAINRLDQLQKSVGLLPLGQPVRGMTEVTSPFGERPDPFLGVMAMHTGIDFRAAQGDPVVATGAGIVSEAGRQGGYGNMVEIDHGNGIATRYGHLSRLAVNVGESVRAGQVIGYAGSTGRSTAPHLHYETRVAGEPVNPTSYLEAGNRLRSLLN